MYNEQDCAEKSIRTLFKTLNDIDPDTQIIAVNDGSIDNTCQILDKLSLEFSRLVVAKHLVNRGYGEAIKTAYKVGGELKLDYLLFMDADLTQDPKYIAGFLPKMKHGYGMIKGSRYIKGGGMENVPWPRVLISIFGNFVAKLQFRLPLNDYTNGFRAVRVDLAAKFNLKSGAFDLLLEEVAQAKKLKASFTEVPYILTARDSGQGQSKFNYSFHTFIRYLRHGFKRDFRV